MVSGRDYGLSWIDQDGLFEVTKKMYLSVTKKKDDQPLDPFTMLVQARTSGEQLADMLPFEMLRSKNKTVSNAVGLWHQRVLGLSEIWNELGSNGGVLDLKSVEGWKSPKFNKPLYAEVKNRFNTIKASNEKVMWDELDNAARMNGAVSYLIQVIPEKPEAYDRQWIPSGRQGRDIFRCCDGVTGYAMSFGRDDALLQLFKALPLVIEDVRVDLGEPISSVVDCEGMEELFLKVFPSAPAR